ncbi:MAG: AAA family ATPase [Nitrososphaerota archaeon]
MRVPDHINNMWVAEVGMMPKREVLQQYYVSTGIDLLDELVFGWPKGRIALLYGHFKSGKTTLAMMASIRTIAEGRHVLYLDAENRVTPMRFYALAEGMVKRNVVTDFDRTRISTHLHLYTATSLAEQHEIVTEDFLEKMKEEDVGLVVIDSVAVYYHDRVLKAPREMTATEAKEVMGKISSELMQLQRPAARLGAPIIAITWSASKAGYALQQWQKRQLVSAIRAGKAEASEVYANLDVLLGTFGSDYVGGQFLGYRAHFLLRLFRLPGELRYAYLTAHGDRPDGYGLQMVMTEAGLLPAPNAKVEKPTEQYVREMLSREEEEVRKDKRLEVPEVKEAVEERSGRKRRK